MKRTRAASVEDLKLLSSYQNIRRTLLQEEYQDRLGKPLAFWALPSDRRLPLAFLGRTLGDLLNTPYEDLAATPGIGQKKICSLVALLNRAATDAEPAAPFGIEQLAESEATAAAAGRTPDGEFDPNTVSESMWLEWVATVRKHQLENEKLGRLAPTLDAIPKVIWNTTLGAYVNYSLAEIRSLRTHGEKRVRVVLEVFSIVNDMLGATRPQPHLALRVAPKFVEPIELWLQECIRRNRAPSVPEIRDQLLLPLLNQTQLDVGEVVADLAASRLGISGRNESVRRQAMELGVTRARVYQLLEQCGDALAVRWPEGRALLSMLEAVMESQPGVSSELSLLRRALELFYPIKLVLPSAVREAVRPAHPGLTHPVEVDRRPAVLAPLSQNVNGVRAAVNGESRPSLV